MNQSRSEKNTGNTYWFSVKAKKEAKFFSWFFFQLFLSKFKKTFRFFLLHQQFLPLNIREKIKMAKLHVLKAEKTEDFEKKKTRENDD